MSRLFVIALQALSVTCQGVVAQEDSVKLLTWSGPLKELAAVRGGFVAANGSDMLWWSHGWVAHQRVEGEVVELKSISDRRRDVVVGAFNGAGGPRVLVFDRWGGSGTMLWKGEEDDYVRGLALAESAGRLVVGVTVRVTEPRSPAVRAVTPSQDHVVLRVLGGGDSRLTVRPWEDLGGPIALVGSGGACLAVVTDRADPSSPSRFAVWRAVGNGWTRLADHTPERTDIPGEGSTLGATLFAGMPIVLMGAPHEICNEGEEGNERIGSVYFWDQFLKRRLFRLDARYGIDMFGSAIASAVVDGRCLVAIGAPQTYGRDDQSGYVLLKEWTAKGQEGVTRRWAGGGREIGSAVAISSVGRVYWLGRSGRHAWVATHNP